METVVRAHSEHTRFSALALSLSHSCVVSPHNSTSAVAGYLKKRVLEITTTDL